MKIRVGLIAAGIAISAGAASAQGIYPRGGYGVASDFGAPYADEPPYAALPREEPRLLPPRVYGPRYGERNYDQPGYAPAVLPPTAVYGILRDSGYSPLGIPQQRGFVYTISVISPDGDDGRLVIDARTGRILRFLPAYRMGDRMSQDITVSYGPAGPVPPLATLNGAPRPPLAVPRLASRSPNVPLPKPMPARAVATPAQPVATKAVAAPASKPADAQASIQKPAEPAAVPATPPAVIEARTDATPENRPPAPPSQEMPPVQGFE
jgi:hypothetical protein